MKLDRAICEEYLGVLQKIKTNAYFEKEFEWIDYGGVSPNEYNILRELEGECIIALMFTGKNNGSLRFGSDTNGIKAEFRLLNANKLERKISYYTKEIKVDSEKPKQYKLGECFGFSGLRFWLRRIADDKLIIDFKPQDKKSYTDSFVFMSALVDFLRGNIERSGDWLKANVPQESITRYVTNNYPRIGVDDNWLKNTKSALVKKIKHDVDYIEVGEFNKNNNTYSISLKIPVSMVE